MKKLSQYLNRLSPEKQRRLLIAFALIFMALLLWSLTYNPITIKPGYAPKYIGRATDSLTKK